MEISSLNPSPSSSNHIPFLFSSSNYLPCSSTSINFASSSREAETLSSANDFSLSSPEIVSSAIKVKSAKRGRFGPLVLIIEEDMKALDMISSEFEKLNYKVLMSRNVQSAFELIHEDKAFDPVILNCPVCGKEFNNIPSLKMHRKKRKTECTKAQLECAFCNTTATSITSIGKHMANHTSEWHQAQADKMESLYQECLGLPKLIVSGKSSREVKEVLDGVFDIPLITVLSDMDKDIQYRYNSPDRVFYTPIGEDASAKINGLIN